MVLRFWPVPGAGGFRYVACVRWFGRDWLVTDGVTPAIRIVKTPQEELESRYRVAQK